MSSSGTHLPAPRCAFYCLQAVILLVITTYQAGLAFAQLRPLTAYEHLERNGFPPGILPQAVKSYDLDDNGKFTVYLERKCSFAISGGKIPVYYAKKITGVMHKGSMKNLAGVQAKAFKMWWSISGIEVKNNDLVLKSGFTSKSFPISNFEEVPVCQGGSLLVTAPISADVVSST